MSSAIQPPMQRDPRPLRARGLAALALLSVAVSLLVQTPVASAQDRPLTVNVVGFSADAWPAPQAVVTVDDDQGRSLADLDPSSFQAQLNGVPVPVTAVTRAVDGSLPI